MKINEKYLFFVALSILFFLTTLTNLEFIYCLVISYNIFVLFRFVNNLGNTFALFDFLVFISSITTLVMPYFGYEVYNKSSNTASIWGKIMSVPKSTYYEYILPCNFVMFLVLKNVSSKVDYKLLSEQLYIYLKEKGKVGVSFTIIGILSGVMHPFLPRVFDAVLGVFMYLKYIGPLYIYFSNLNFKKYYLAFSIVLMVSESLVTGMFGELLNNILLITIVISALIKTNNKFSFLSKLSFFTLAMFMVLVLQSMKPLYRLVTWKKQTVEGLSLKTHSSSEVFRKLYWDRFSNPSRIFDEETMFGPYVRFNQGILIAAAMDYVPRVKPFANGETITKQVLSIAIPRAFYADKYHSGGEENMLRFTGTVLRGVSMNVGIYGEFYGNYGPVGGVLGVACYAFVLFLTWRLLVGKIKKNIEWVLWMPNLYYYSLSVETDMFTALNTFIKSFIVVYLILYLLRSSDNLQKKNSF